MMLINLQQIQQLQSLFTDESTTSTSNSNTVPFADIFATLLGESNLLQPALINPTSPLESGKPNLYEQTNQSFPPAENGNTFSSLESVFNYFASQYNLNPNLLKAVAKTESNFNPDAESAAGAQGIMQLMPRTAKSLGVEDSFNPLENIEGGAKYLRTLLNKFEGNTELALAAYNAGPTAVAKYDGIPPYKETQSYVKKVMANLVDFTG